MKVPGRFQGIVNDVVRKILSIRSDIRAVIVIGSVAKGDYADDSDVDIVCVTRDKLNRKERFALMQSVSKRVQLVPFFKEELDKHFQNATTMAHSIQKGLVVYEKGGFLEPYLNISFDLPSVVWLKEWFVHWLEFYYMGLLDLARERKFHERFCNEECHCFISDNLPRAAVNFAMLYLEVKGTVPVSKGEIREGIKGQIADDIMVGLKTALQVCHEERDMVYDEAVAIEKTATWLKERLIEALRLSDKEMEKPLKLYEMLKATEGESSHTKEKPV
jgi:predicted nucleotidyltransferase